MKEQKLQLRFVRDAALPVLLSEVTLFKCKVLLIAGLYFGTRLIKTGFSVPYKMQSKIGINADFLLVDIYNAGF